MKVDLYTKSVLTVIAVCLVILTLQTLQLVPKTYAVPASATAAFNNEVRHHAGADANLVLIAARRGGKPGVMLEPEVKISTPMSGLPVQIKDIGTYDELKVQVTNSYINTKSY